MGYRVSFKQTHDELLSDIYPEWVKELRLLLPSLSFLSDEELVKAWKAYSFNQRYMGWLIPNEDSINHFLSVIEVIDEDTDKVVKF